jgi:hypothetical protein
LLGYGEGSGKDKEWPLKGMGYFWEWSIKNILKCKMECGCAYTALCIYLNYW